jgi:APA family basic amino acid/polyamine antiporter
VERIPTSDGESTATVESAGGGGFARRSSGLVRDFSQTDSWIYNVLAINPVVVGALTFVLVVVTYPRANLWLAFIIAGIFCCLEAIAYALFTAAMPRSGGDYILQGRVLGGGVASVVVLAGSGLATLFVAGIFGYILATIVLAPFFSLLGAYNHVEWMTNFGSWLVTKWGIFICAMFVIAQSVLVNIRGLRLYARIQRYVFWPGMALLLMFTILLLVTSHTEFVKNFNSFMSSKYGVHDAYQTTINRGGAVDTSFSFGDTIKASVIAAFLLIFPAWSVYQAGEVRRANSVRRNLAAMLGAEAFCVAVMAILGALLVSRVGTNFLYASGSLFFGGAANNPLPVPPFLGFFFAIAGNAAVFVWLALVMFACWTFMLYTNTWVGVSRLYMAMAFDRVLPQWFGQVNRRVHVPLNAIFAFSLLSIPVTPLYIWEPSIQAFTLSFFIILITTFGVTMVAAIVFPWVRRDLYEASPAAKYKVAGLPLLSVAGAGFLAFVIYADVQALRADELGVNSKKGLLFLLVLWGTAFFIYWASRLYRRQFRGEDITRAYRELPVE